jgi:hypothetical protein
MLFDHVVIMLRAQAGHEYFIKPLPFYIINSIWSFLDRFNASPLRIQSAFIWPYSPFVFPSCFRAVRFGVVTYTVFNCTPLTLPSLLCRTINSELLWIWIRRGQL